MPLNRVTLLSLFAVAALAGCSAKDTSSDTASQAAQTPSTPSASCDAKAVQTLVGKTIDPTLTEQARRDAGASVARVLRPHQPVRQFAQAFLVGQPGFTVGHAPCSPVPPPCGLAIVADPPAFG